jgi:aspartokinase/homoserine dehydrogenase 1
MAAKVESLKAAGRLLRYLAVIDSVGHKAGGRLVRVRPMDVDMSHPASRLRGSEAFIAFTSERYQRYPLIVQGAGAGGAVTAAGVLADTLTLAQMLRGK